MIRRGIPRSRIKRILGASRVVSLRRRPKGPGLVFTGLKSRFKPLVKGPRKTSQNQHELLSIAKLGEGRSTRGSGAVFNDGDIRVLGKYLFEHKWRKNPKFNLNYKVWTKVKKQAFLRSLEPGLWLATPGLKDIVLLEHPPFGTLPVCSIINRPEPRRSLSLNMMDVVGDLEMKKVQHPGSYVIYWVYVRDTLLAAMLLSDFKEYLKECPGQNR